MRSRPSGPAPAIGRLTGSASAAGLTAAGTAAAATLVSETAQKFLTARGYAVTRNAPYAGGFTTVHYGRPGEGGHALQIEINRSLYMNERTMERKPGIAGVAADMAELAATLAALPPDLLAA